MGRGQHPGRSQAQDAQRGPAEAWRRGLMRDSLKHAGDRAQLHKLLGTFPAVLGNGVLPPPQPVLGVSSGNKQNPCGPDAWGLSRCAQGAPVCRGAPWQNLPITDSRSHSRLNSSKNPEDCQQPNLQDSMGHRLSSCSCSSKWPQSGSKQHEFLISQLWRLEV